MREMLDLFHTGKPEEVKNKKERLTPIFEKSRKLLERLEVTRKRRDSRIENLSGLVVMDINEDGPELCLIDEDGNPSASATMLWSEIIDAKPEKK
jgi:hypothetical protein